MVVLLDLTLPFIMFNAAASKICLDVQIPVQEVKLVKSIDNLIVGQKKKKKNS